MRFAISILLTVEHGSQADPFRASFHQTDVDRLSRDPEKTSKSNVSRQTIKLIELPEEFKSHSQILFLGRVQRAHSPVCDWHDSRSKSDWIETEVKRKKHPRRLFLILYHAAASVFYD